MSIPVLSFQHRKLRVFISLLFGIELLILLGDLIFNHAGLGRSGPVMRFFNVTREDSFGSWFGVSQTLLVALTLWLIWLLVRQSEAGSSRPRKRLRPAHGWCLLAVLFTYMAMDDGAMVHERIGTIFERNAGAAAPGSVSAWLGASFPTYFWQVLFVPFFAAMGLFMLFFMWKQQPSDFGRWLVFCGLGCFGAAVVLDFFEGMRPENPWNLLRSVRLSTGWSTATVEHLCRAVEETIEMAGMTLLWAAFLHFLFERFPKFTVQVRAKK